MRDPFPGVTYLLSYNMELYEEITMKKLFNLAVLLLFVVSLLFSGCGASAPESTAGKTGGDLLLVIDMQNAYTPEGPWTCPRIDQAAENIVSLIESGTFEQIIFTRFDAPTAPVGTWNDYNEINRDVNEDVYLNEIIPQLKVYEDVFPMYSKSTYSSMTIPEVRSAATECIERGGSVVVTGVVSECCVIATALEAVDMGCPVIYLKDACAGADDALEQSVVDILSVLDYVQTTILDTDEYLQDKAA